MDVVALLNIFLGINVVVAFMVLALILCLKKHEYWLGFASNLLAAFYCYNAITGVYQNVDLSIYLASSLAAVLFCVPLIWKDMLFNIVDHSYQWGFLIVIVSLLLLNHLLLNQLLIYLLMPVFVSTLILFRSIYQHGALVAKLDDMAGKLDSANVKNGFDVSTGLPNKTGFSQQVEKWLYQNSSESLDIIAFKFTRFAELNRLIGHNHADIVKLQLISRLKKKLEKVAEIVTLTNEPLSTVFASAGGVDFLMAIKKDTNVYATEHIIDLLSNSISEPIVVDATAVDIGVDFGVSSYPEQGHAIESLIENAFLALEQPDKQSHSIYFDNSQTAKLLAKKSIISQLKNDLNTDRFVVYVHPQIDLKSKKVLGGELLVRWNREGEGIVSAREFIELAEQSGIIYQLNMWTIEKAIQALAILKSNDSPQTLSVNISNRELLQSHLVESILNFLDEYMVEPSKLIVEIKESAFAENKTKALKVTRLLAQSGIKVAIDDFGKDLSALETFSHFTPYYVKVDCKHISRATKGHQLNTYINAIIGMAKSLNIPVVAQGIETEETELQLIDLNCETGQGFFYSKPFELSGFSVWVEQWRRVHQRHM
ncbi:GGDEF domain-containing phosphodiesterase [Psychrosphaera haliotis]|uniref:EAL domain-containing protein n=1 Tax=Psychrosphaera haliotis TaxID=555083 RepID=A0A6N8F7Z5_9GAMM|nr:GGDEF domain-containing phosphodiesterase [Psychrosphaera haliotis]MUH72676.1 EAL domain-containing protein [Psychrosphaera haliotis]